MYLKIYRLWKSTSGYSVKIDINKFDEKPLVLKNGSGEIANNIEMISNLKSFFTAAYLDVLNQSTPAEGTSQAFSLQFAASL